MEFSYLDISRVLLVRCRVHWLHFSIMDSPKEGGSGFKAMGMIKDFFGEGGGSKLRISVCLGGN